MTVYYCSWATGDDTTGDGSAGTPWKTITKATTGRSAGDEVRVAKSAAPTALTGTVGFTVNSTAVTGSGTAFTTELVIGDFILAPDGQYYEVITLTSDTAAVLYKKYPSATQSGFSSYKLGVTDTGAAAAATTAIQTVSASGSAESLLVISGGWDLSTQEQTGQTYFRQMHATFANRYGRGLYMTGKSYTTISRLHFLRYGTGVYYTTASNNNVLTSPTCCSNGVDGILYTTSHNNVLTSPTCNSNNSSGVVFDGSNNNTLTSPICNSNGSNGIYHGGGCNNVLTSPTCNSNVVHGVHYKNSSNNNTCNSPTCNSNAYDGVVFEATSNNNTLTSPTCNSNRYGVVYLNSNNNTVFGTLTTSSNSSAAIRTAAGINRIATASLAEGAKVSTAFTNYDNPRLFINNLGGYSYIYTDNGNVVSQDATAGGTGKEWKFSPTNAIRNNYYPLDLSIARFAVASTGQVTVTCYFKKSATSVAGALRCRYGQVAWSDAASDIVVNCPDDTNRNQVTLQFTPTEAGVVEVEALAWYVSATDQNVIIDDIAISQA